ncbi:MAG: SGNH/GDSL hydrolase family protein [Gordonia sp. (in: high G+C Gram-positive bacteria)]
MTAVNNRPIRGLVVGASTAEGAKAVPWTARFTSHLEKSFQHVLNPKDVPGGYVIRARDSAWNPTGLTYESEIDLGIRNRLLSPGSSLSHRSVQPTTGVQILYAVESEPVKFVVRIDDDEHVVHGTPAKDGLSLRSWESPVYARAIHDYSISTNVPVSLGNTAFRDGDRDRGFALYQGAHAGWGARDFLLDDAESMWTRCSTLRPDMALICLGTNDRGNRVTPDVFGSQVNAIIDRLSLYAQGPQWILLVGQHNLSSRGPAPWTEYLRVLASIAEHRKNVTYVSFYEYMPQTPGTINDPDDLISNDDDTHMTAKGHQLAGSVIDDQLGIKYSRSWP